MKKNIISLKFNFRLTFVFALLVLILSTCISISYADTKIVNKNSVNSRNWMSFLPNTASIGAINIPATHDSGCTDFLDVDIFSHELIPLAKTQNLNFKEQLNSGIREFDIRISRPEALVGYKDSLVINHGGICAQRIEDMDFLTMEDVVRYSRNFLQENPSETVILRWNSEKGGSMDIDENGRYGQLVKDFTNELKANGDIVLELNDSLPTVGEARGKIVAFETHIMKKDDIEYEGVTGYEKWYGGKRYKKDENFYGIEHYFNEAVRQDYVRQIKLIGDKHTDGLQFIGTDVYSFSLGIPDDRRKYWLAPYVNEKLLNYSYKKGYYYGWISMDYVTEDLAKTIYMTNIFDFDEKGESISYISDINYAYDQDIAYAKSILEKKGYTVLEENFNCEGPDKIFSNAVVNGRRNKGSFNIAVGYKTTNNPMNAITGLKFVTFPPMEKKPSENALNFINDGNYKQIKALSSFDYPKQSDVQFTEYELCSFNIGAKGAFPVVLYYTKDTAEGERLYDVQSLEMLNKTEPGSDESDYLNEQVKKLLNSGYLSPRDYKNNMFGSNYGRNLENDVCLFYKRAFQTSIPSTDKDKEFKILGTVSEDYSKSGSNGFFVSENEVSIYLVKNTKPVIYKVSKLKGKKNIIFNNVQWDTANKVQINKYQLYRSTSKKFNKKLKKITFSVKNSRKVKLNFRDKTSVSKKKYYYKLRGIIKIGKKNYYTKWSNIKY